MEPMETNLPLPLDLLDLPTETLEQILQNVPHVDLKVNVRLVNKFFFELIANRFNIVDHLELTLTDEKTSKR